MVPPLLPRAHSAVSVVSTIAASARLPAAAIASLPLLHSELLCRPAAQPEAGSASGTSGTYGWAQGEPRGIRASTPGARVFPWCFL